MSLKEILTSGSATTDAELRSQVEDYCDVLRVLIGTPVVPELSRQGIAESGQIMISDITRKALNAKLAASALALCTVQPQVGAQEVGSFVFHTISWGMVRGEATRFSVPNPNEPSERERRVVFVQVGFSRLYRHESLSELFYTVPVNYLAAIS